MDRNYWKEYWESYCKFMALYLRELQDAYPDADIKEEYLQAANLFDPTMPFEDFESYYEYYADSNNYSEMDNNQPSTSGGGQSGNPFTSGGGQSSNPFTFPGGTPFISPGSGQFTINNCRRMAIVRIVMRRGFNPSEFFMVVDRADNRSIRGFRIACEGGRIRFVPMAVEFRNINVIECAFQIKSNKRYLKYITWIPLISLKSYFYYSYILKLIKGDYYGKLLYNR